jgi:hypothetical protein
MYKNNILILIIGLATLPILYVIANWVADMWEKTVGKVMGGKKFWIRRYIIPFLILSGIVHIFLFGVLPIIYALT